MASVKKKTELDILNVFLCVLVVFIHAASEAVTGLPASAPMFLPVCVLWKAATVAVPGFLFVSGIKLGLSLKNQNKNYISFLGNKLLKIYLPYAVYVLLYYLYFVSEQYFEFEFSALFSYIFIGDLTAHFYYIVILMQFFILMPILKQWVEKAHPAFLLTTSLLITILFGQFLPDILRAISGGTINLEYNDRIFTSYLFYYVFGMLAGHKYNAFLAFLKENKKGVIGFGVFVLLLNTVLYGIERTSGTYFGFAYLLQTVYCVGVLPLLMLITVSLSKGKAFESKWFQTANGATYSVYLLHLLVMFIINDNIINVNNFGVFEAFCIRFALVFVISFALCMGYVWIKQIISKKES